MEKLKDSMKNLKVFEKKYYSIIDIDMYFFGLIYFIIFEEKEIKLDEERRIQLFLDLEDKIKEFKKIEGYNEAINYHRRNPAALKYITIRVNSSIDIYSSYTSDMEEINE